MNFYEEINVSFLDNIDSKALEREMELDDLWVDIKIDAVIRSLENNL